MNQKWYEKTTTSIFPILMTIAETPWICEKDSDLKFYEDHLVGFKLLHASRQGDEAIRPFLCLYTKYFYADTRHYCMFRASSLKQLKALAND